MIALDHASKFTLPWNDLSQFFTWACGVVLLSLVVFAVYRYITREDRQMLKRVEEQRTLSDDTGPYT